MPERHANVLAPAGRIIVLLLLSAALILPGVKDRDRASHVAILFEAADGSASTTATQLQAQLTSRSGKTTLAAATIATSAGGLDEALHRALREMPPASQNAIVIVSDGDWPANVEPLLKQIGDADIAVHWVPSKPRDNARLLHVAARDRARPGDVVPVVVTTGLLPEDDFELVLKASGRPVAHEAPGRDGNTTFQLAVPDVAAVRLDVELVDRSSAAVIDRLENAAVINVAKTPKVLVLANKPSPLGEALAAGGWRVSRASTRDFPAMIDSLGKQSALIIDDVPVDALPDDAWRRIVDAVRREALGLLVLGGPNSFGLGAYRGSLLESILPVVSEPPQREQPADLVFVIDVSGSMGRDDNARLAMARSAVLHTAQAMRPSDRVGLIGFDVEARQLLPAEARDSHSAALDAAWPQQASGGTRVMPALQAGLSALAGRSGRQQILVLVTDGQIAEDEIAGIESLLAGSSIEFVGMLLGEASNEAPLSRIATNNRATLLSIDDVLRLPVLMRDELEKRRPALVRAATLPVVQGNAALQPPNRGWPSLDAYLVTRPRPAATVLLSSPEGEPLLAEWTAGAGRVVVATGGLDQWAGRWLAWESWPALAANLTRHLIVRGSARVRIERTEDDDGSALAFDVGGDSPPQRIRLIDEDTVTSVEPIAIAPGIYRIPITETRNEALRVVWESADGTHRVDIAAAARRPESGGEPMARRFLQMGLVRAWQDESIATLRPAPDWRRHLVAAALLSFLLVLALERLPLREWWQYLPRITRANRRR